MAKESDIRGLMRDYTPLAVKIANGFKRRLPPHVRLDDLRAAAMSGLWDAVRLKPDADYFEQYARVRISGAIKDDLRGRDWLPRSHRSLHPRDGRTVLQLNEVMEGALSVEDDIEGRLDRTKAIGKIQEAAELLPDRHKLVFLGRHVAGRKMKNIADELGVTQARASQIYGEALAMIRKTLELDSVAEDGERA